MPSLTETLGKRLSKTELVERFQKEASLFGEALALATTDLKPQAWRATWLLRHAMRGQDARIQEKTDLILSVLPHREEGHQRELLKLIEGMSFTEEQESKLFDFCLGLWETISKSSSVRVTAFKMMAQIAKKYPELQNELKFLTQDQYTESLSPGIKRSFEKMK